MRRLLPILFLLAACDSPTPGMGRAQSADVAVGGMTFGVHWTTEYAEAYRTNRQWRPRLSHVLANANAAIEQATGCAVRKGSLTGDQAIVKARLNCPDTPDAGPVATLSDCQKTGHGRLATLECNVALPSTDGL